MIQKEERKNKCNFCGARSEYYIVLKKLKNTTRIHSCKECLSQINYEISCSIAPKSPRNILNKF